MRVEAAVVSGIRRWVRLRGRLPLRRRRTSLLVELVEVRQVVERPAIRVAEEVGWQGARLPGVELPARKHPELQQALRLLGLDLLVRRSVVRQLGPRLRGHN
jgi:hypothetical protein